MTARGWIVQLFAITIHLFQGETTAATTFLAQQSNQAIKQDEITILKIGGSSITNKAREETLNHEALDWFAKLVAESVDPYFLSSDKNEMESNGKAPRANRPNRRFIIVHGAGSFGHHSAKRYGLRCGKAAFLEESDNRYHPNNPLHPAAGDPSADATTAGEVAEQRYQMLGFAKTRRSVQKLNAACVSSLVDNGVNAVGISPGASFPGLRGHGATGLPRGARPRDHPRDDSPRGMRDLAAAIGEALRAGLVPVVHGDACLLYDGLRAGILGGDTIAEGIVAVWDDGMINERGKSNICQVIFITDVAGVFTSDPKSDNNAELIRSITVNKDTGELTIDNQKDDGDTIKQGHVLNVSGSSHRHDVTGGLKAKLGAAVAIVQEGIEVVITQCGSDTTEKIVQGNWSSIYDVEAGTLLSR